MEHKQRPAKRRSMEDRPVPFRVCLSFSFLSGGMPGIFSFFTGYHYYYYYLYTYALARACVCAWVSFFIFSYNQMSAVPKTVVARWNPGCRRSHVFSAYYVQKYKPKNNTRNSCTNLLQRGLPRVIIDSSVSTRRGVAVDGRRQIDLADGKHVKSSLKIVLKNPRLTDGFA